MYIIQKIVNYDPDYLELQSSIAIRSCEEDKTLEKLFDEKDRFHFILRAIKVISVILMGYMTGVIITGPSFRLILPPCAIMLMIAVFLRLAPAYYEKNISARDKIIDSYISPAVQYHHLVSTHQFLVCYGRVVDGKFVAFLFALADREDEPEDSESLTAEVSRHCVKRITFRFDDSNKEGVLTLDVGNEVVYFSRDCE